MNLIVALLSFLCLAGQGLPASRQTASDLDKLEHRTAWIFMGLVDGWGDDHMLVTGAIAVEIDRDPQYWGRLARRGTFVRLESDQALLIRDFATDGEAHRLLSPTRYPRRTPELDKLDATGLTIRAGTIVRLTEVARDPPNVNNGTMGVYGRIEATTADAVDRWMRGLERR